MSTVVGSLNVNDYLLHCVLLLRSLTKIVYGDRCECGTSGVMLV